MAPLAPVQHFISHKQSWAPSAELHVELGALVLSQTAQQPTLPGATRASPLPGPCRGSQVTEILVQIQALTCIRHVTLVSF